MPTQKSARRPGLDPGPRCLTFSILAKKAGPRIKSEATVKECVCLNHNPFPGSTSVRRTPNLSPTLTISPRATSRSEISTSTG